MDGWMEKYSFEMSDCIKIQLTQPDHFTSERLGTGGIKIWHKSL